MGYPLLQICLNLLEGMGGGEVVRLSSYGIPSITNLIFLWDSDFDF